MSTEVRRARLRALAKINLSLKVLGRRPDGYHELRTIFQTISLADTLEVAYTPSRRSSVELESNIEIPDNLVVRAARRLMEATGRGGRVWFRLRKRIPMGSGLGGGSSDAAAVLLGLPVLAGWRVPPAELVAIGAELGSDVPFFLLGGTALGIGRGTEIAPLPEERAGPGLLVIPPLRISTREAYAALDARLTSAPGSNKIGTFQSLLWFVGQGVFTETSAEAGENDFEAFAYPHYPQLAAIQRKLRRLGARPAMLSGSGSAVFGIFRNREKRQRARRSFPDQQTEPFYLVSRSRYRRMWWRSLLGHLRDQTWPPRSRYAR